MQSRSRKVLFELGRQGGSGGGGDGDGKSLTSHVVETAGGQARQAQLASQLDASRLALRDSEASRRRVESRLAKELSYRELLQRQLSRAAAEATAAAQRQLQRDHGGQSEPWPPADGGMGMGLGTEDLARRIAEMQVQAEREATRLHADLEVAFKQREEVRARYVHGVCMVCSWCVHGVCMVCAWCVHGVRMVCAWCAHGVCMVHAWGMHGACKAHHLEEAQPHEAQPPQSPLSSRPATAAPPCHPSPAHTPTRPPATRPP